MVLPLERMRRSRPWLLAIEFAGEVTSSSSQLGGTLEWYPYVAENSLSFHSYSAHTESIAVL